MIFFAQIGMDDDASSGKRLMCGGARRPFSDDGDRGVPLRPLRQGAEGDTPRSSSAVPSSSWCLTSDGCRGTGDEVGRGSYPVWGSAVDPPQREAGHADIGRWAAGTLLEVGRGDRPSGPAVEPRARPPAECQCPVKMRSCQPLWASPVMSDITCLTLVYSSNEYVDMSLPNPDAL